MVVYVELAVLNNFIISFVLLFLTKITCIIKGKNYRLILSSLFSSLISLILPLIILHAILILFIKILIGFLCVAIAFKTENIKKLLKYFLVYLGLTLAFGGVVYASFELFKIKLAEVAFVNSPFIIAIITIYVLLFVFVFNVIKLIKILNKQRKVATFLYTVKVTINNKTYSTNAFLDSGNRLKDTISGEGINIITFTFLSKFLPPETLLKLAEHSKENLGLTNAHFVEFSSVGASKQKMLVFNANSIEINSGKNSKKLDSPMLGVVFKKFADSIDYDILLSSEIANKI